MTRREQIRAAALAHFSRTGYHGASMRAIAEDVGIRGGSLYAHITGKEQLLAEVVTGALDALRRGLRAAVDPHAPAPVRLRQAVRFHVRYHAEHPAEARVLGREAEHLSPAYGEGVAARRHAYTQAFAAILEDGVARGEFRRVAPDPVLRAILALGPAAADGAAGELPDTIAELYADLVVRAVAARPEAEPVRPGLPRARTYAAS